MSYANTKAFDKPTNHPNPKWQGLHRIVLHPRLNSEQITKITIDVSHLVAAHAALETFIKFTPCACYSNQNDKRHVTNLKGPLPPKAGFLKAVLMKTLA